ncbi:hypothetical protein KM043_010824 [Ampulex compressa]|nr:hypothetical protein KM043_010824 [Ampulex compressa]
MLLKRAGKKVLLRVKPSRGKRRRTKRFENLLHALEHYCTNTSLHGLRYLVDPELRVAERLVWLVIFAISAAVASKVIYTLAHRFQAAPTSIGIESMNYKISGVPFPSVTLCPNDRVDWDKALALEERIFPNATDVATVQTFREILVKLSMLSFGDFDELSFLKERNIDGLARLNVTEILLDVIPSCEDLFSACWWRNANRNCCDIFEVQKTEYGFCYAFNSELAEPNARRSVSEIRPRRASGYGDWSGIKVTIHLANVTRPPDSGENADFFHSFLGSSHGF